MLLRSGAKVLLVLMTIVPSVILMYSDKNYEDEIIEVCKKESTTFTANELQFAEKKENVDESKPDLHGPIDADGQEKAYEIEKRQRVFECITDRMKKSSEIAAKLNLKYQSLEIECKSAQPQPDCNPDYPYRTLDGTCNNLLYPKWGSVFSCLQRFLPPNYEGTSGFRRSVRNGAPLPEPRFLSLQLDPDRNRPIRDITNLFTNFGQLLAHDMEDTPSTLIGNATIDCCSGPNNEHPQCAPILLKPDDPFYSKYNVTCLNFVRSSPCGSCSIGKRNQMNAPTSYIDCSFVYGSDDKSAERLRTNDGTGKLRTQHHKTGELLPKNYDLGSICEAGQEEYFFLAGDRRVNMHSSLTSLQTLFMREHNRIAEILKELNNNWKGEPTYQEARKILIAQMQVITYNEMLPKLLGPDLMDKYGLNILEEGNTVYNPNVNPTIWAEFNTAAFRLHTMVNGIVTKPFRDESERMLRHMYGNISIIYQGKMDSLVKGMSLTPAQKYDLYLSEDLTDFLYKTAIASYGLDIAAADIQRGRDNGIPTYIEMVRFLSNDTIKINDFDDLAPFMSPENVLLLKSAYRDVRDIDLWVGMNMECVPHNMLVGRTAAEIIGMQFSELKYGDRFYFEHCGNFNDEQLQTLKRASLSKIICDNSDTSMIQPKSMMYPSKRNPIQVCFEIPGVDLFLWKDWWD